MSPGESLIIMSMTKLVFPEDNWSYYTNTVEQKKVSTHTSTTSNTSNSINSSTEYREISKIVQIVIRDVNVVAVVQVGVHIVPPIYDFLRNECRLYMSCMIPLRTWLILSSVVLQLQRDL